MSGGFDVVLRRRALLVLALAGLLPAVPATASEGAPAAAIPAFAAPFRVDAPDGLADFTVIGVDERATAGYDVGIDAPEPPPPPAGPWVQAYVADAGNGSVAKLHRSVLGRAAEATWIVRADVDGPAGTVRLSWSPSAFADVPTAFGVDARWGANQSLDARAAQEIVMTKPEGLASLLVEVRVAPLEGTAPSAPTGLRAVPGPRLGDVSLSWSAPEDDGGHPLRRYHVYRADDGGPFVHVATTAAPAHVDSGRPLGGLHRYAVSAVNRVGEGPASDAADAIGTGKPPLLSGEPQPGVRERRIWIHEARVPAHHVGTPGVDAPLVRARGGPQTVDPRYYELELAALDQPSRKVTVFTGVPLPLPFSADLLRLPSGVAMAPGAAVLVELTARSDGALVLRATLEPEGLRVEESVAVPLVGRALEALLGGAAHGPSPAA